jgi:hypothetical protein
METLFVSAQTIVRQSNLEQRDKIWILELVD